MTVILIIALLIMILMPCTLYFDTLNDLFDKINTAIFERRATRIAAKQAYDVEKEYQEKIDTLNKETDALHKETEALYEEIDTLNKKLQESQQQEKEIKRVIDNKNKIINEIKEDSLRQHREKDEQIKELQTKIELLEMAKEKIKQQAERAKNEGENKNESKTENKNKDYKKDFRKKYPADIRCQDGDYVRSKSERDIDDFFFQNKIWHIYEPTYIEPKTKKKHYPDFYLPDYNLYIEYFGMTKPEYLEKRDRKITMYLSDNSINFEYLTQADDNDIYEKLKDICRKYSIPTK